MADGLTTQNDPTQREDLAKKPKFSKAAYWLAKRQKKQKKRGKK